MQPMKKKKKYFHDILIPIILVMSILPFITRLILYDCGLSVYPWYSDNSVVTDFFSYYKSYFLSLISIIAVIILIIFFLLYRKSVKNMKAFLPLGIYAIVIILSTIFSISSQTSMTGGISHFENTFVLLGYIIMAVYTYQFVVTEADFQIIMKTFLVSIVIMSIIGFFQMIGKDLLELIWVQKLVIPSEFWDNYLGSIHSQLQTNAVSLTLFNPNYASVYVAMIIPLLAVFMLSAKVKKLQILYLTLICFLMLILFKTYSRTGLVSLFVTFILLIYFYRNHIKHIWKQSLAAILLCISLFVLLDSQSDFRFITKISATFTSFNKIENTNALEHIETNENNIYIRYQASDLYVSISDDPNAKRLLIFTNASGDDISNQYNVESDTLDVEPFDEIQFWTENMEGKEYIIAVINENTWKFCFDYESGYIYLNDLGKYDKLVDIETFGFQNHENLASGRGFIWSRSIPLLKTNLLLGSGPDTFPIVFPQSDYVGKANNCKTIYTLIEKPHSLYLMIGIQTGIISLLCFLCFYLVYLFRSIRLYQRNTANSYIEQIGLGCLLATVSYMVSGFFNDSSLQTSPLFWILIGLGMAANCIIKNKRV